MRSTRWMSSAGSLAWPTRWLGAEDIHLVLRILDGCLVCAHVGLHSVGMSGKLALGGLATGNALSQGGGNRLQGTELLPHAVEAGREIWSSNARCGRNR